MNSIESSIWFCMSPSSQSKYSDFFLESEHLATQLLFELKKQKHTLAVAESCTGGLLSSAITQIPGSSAVFWGGAITYANELKSSLLKVSEEDLLTHGAVSETVAKKMVEGALTAFKVSAAISVTGIAGPSGGTAEKPVGTVWFGFQGPGFADCQMRQFQGTRFEIQSQSVMFALKHFLKLCAS